MSSPWGSAHMAISLPFASLLPLSSFFPRYRPFALFTISLETQVIWQEAKGGTSRVNVIASAWVPCQQSNDTELCSRINYHQRGLRQLPSGCMTLGSHLSCLSLPPHLHNGELAWQPLAYTGACTHIFKEWHQTKCPSADGWVKATCIYTTEYRLHKKEQSAVVCSIDEPLKS